ncbi:MAG: OmpH family outer membrane protein [Alphaproteobacteria bacterium]
MSAVLLRLLAVMIFGNLLGVSTLASAAEPKVSATSLEIAVVDVQKILRESEASKTIRPQLAKLKKEYRARFKQQEQDLRAANQDLSRQRTILSPEAYDEQRKAFRKRASKVQREVQAAQRQLDGALATAMRKVHRALLGITAKYARKEGVMMILPKSGVLLMEPRFDITGEILKRLNKQLPTVTIELPSASADGAARKDGKK